LASFLSWLNKLPDRVTGIEGRVINLEDVVLDEYILETLERKI
jgi:hypothetical protein